MPPTLDIREALRLMLTIRHFDERALADLRRLLLALLRSKSVPVAKRYPLKDLLSSNVLQSRIQILDSGRKSLGLFVLGAIKLTRLADHEIQMQLDMRRTKPS